MQKQQGAGFWGVLLMLAVFVGIGLLAAKIVPIYLKDYAIQQSMSVMDTLTSTKLTSDAVHNAKIIKKRLMDQFSLDGVQIDKDHVSVEPTDKKNVYRMHVDYQVVQPLFYNVGLVFTFHESKEIKLAKGE